MKKIFLSVALAMVASIGALGQTCPGTCFDFVIANSASYEQRWARGALMTVFTNRQVSNDNQTYPTPVTVTTDGMRLGRTHQIAVAPSTPVDLPLIGVYTLTAANGVKYNQINFYNTAPVPAGDATPAPAWTCDDVLGQPNLYTIFVPPAYRSLWNNEQWLESNYNTSWSDSPALFLEEAPGRVPALVGHHLRWYDGAITPLPTCDATPSSCPVSSTNPADGKSEMNYLIAYTTGHYQPPCIGAANCAAAYSWRFLLWDDARTVGVFQGVEFWGRGTGFLGYEQINIRINPGTPAGAYWVSLFNLSPGDPVNQSGQSLLRVKLGAPN
ncbi:MAG: hypothetical protein ACREAM_02625 [Blastocatellia bacterium]